ncbi:hypothetical protein WN943_026530 [Citrus x changshan-huyou]
MSTELLVWLPSADDELLPPPSPTRNLLGFSTAAGTSGPGGWACGGEGGSSPIALLKATSFGSHSISSHTREQSANNLRSPFFSHTWYNYDTISAERGPQSSAYYRNSCIFESRYS